MRCSLRYTVSFYLCVVSYHIYFNTILCSLIHTDNSLDVVHTGITQTITSLSTLSIAHVNAILLCAVIMIATRAITSLFFHLLISWRAFPLSVSYFVSCTSALWSNGEDVTDTVDVVDSSTTSIQTVAACRKLTLTQTSEKDVVSNIGLEDQSTCCSEIVHPCFSETKV